MRGTLLVAHVIVVALLGPLRAAAANTFETRLTNGLKVVVREDHRAPTVVHMVWYRTGAMDEVDGTSGVAHVLEHMMFKQTRKLKVGEFNKRVADAGGRDNAFTSLDYTAYFQQIPREALASMMALEADRMANLVISEEEFGKELKVVMEERRLRTEDQPRSLVYEKLMATAFQAHPYRRPIIGWMGDLEQMRATDARRWYRDWYSPNNATLVVVGDVDHQEVFRLARRHYGGIATRPLPVRKISPEPEQLGTKSIEVEAAAKLPYLAMAWKVPKLTDIARDREGYALEILAGILDGHDAARLARNLVRTRKLAVSVGAGYDATLRGEALFMLDGTPAENQSVDTLKAALRDELDRIRDEGISPQELARVKTQVLAAEIYKRDSLFAQAMEIGRMEVIGFSWRDTDRLLEGLQRVTAEDVQSVVRKYFNDKNLTVAVLVPRSAANGSGAAPAIPATTQSGEPR